jgi:hypothetical protein
MVIHPNDYEHRKYDNRAFCIGVSRFLSFAERS